MLRGLDEGLEEAEVGRTLDLGPGGQSVGPEAAAPSSSLGVSVILIHILEVLSPSCYQFVSGEYKNLVRMPVRDPGQPQGVLKILTLLQSSFALLFLSLSFPFCYLP